VVRFIHFLWQNSSIRPTYVNRAISDRMQTPVAAQSEASVCGRSLVGIECSNPARDSGCLSVVSVACYQVEVSASD